MCRLYNINTQIWDSVVVFSFKHPTSIRGLCAPGLCSFASVLQGKWRALSLQLLLGQLGQLFGFPPLQLLLEEEQVDVDDVI